MKFAWKTMFWKMADSWCACATGSMNDVTIVDGLVLRVNLVIRAPSRNKHGVVESVEVCLVLSAYNYFMWRYFSLQPPHNIPENETGLRLKFHQKSHAEGRSLKKIHFFVISTVGHIFIKLLFMLWKVIASLNIII